MSNLSIPTVSSGFARLLATENISVRVDSSAPSSERIPDSIGIQGNIDPGILFGDEDTIKKRINETFEKIKGRKYILNLGHGILPGTPESNAKTFFEHSKKLSY